MPLKLCTIEAKPKRVYKADTFRDSVGLKSKLPDLAANLVLIVRCIESGHPIPERFYRSRREETDDELLELLGVMHLHLDNPGSRELLYLVQFDDHVVLLEVSDHIHVDTQPRGEILKRIHVLPPTSFKVEHNDRLQAGLKRLKRRE